MVSDICSLSNQTLLACGYKVNLQVNHSLLNLCACYIYNKQRRGHLVGSREYALDGLAADVEALEGLPGLDLLEDADPLLHHRLQVGLVRHDSRIPHRLGGEEETSGAGREAGKRVLPEEREASSEADKHVVAAAGRVRLRQRVFEVSPAWS